MTVHRNTPIKKNNIVYNITMQVDHPIHNEWLPWQKEEQIPAIMATRLFTEYRFFHLLEQDETGAITYVIQYFAPSMAHYEKFIEEFAPFLRSKAKDRWGDRLVVFHTIMEVMH